MRKSLRLLAAAAALNVMTGTGVAVAQTVLVRHAPPAETVELMLNATKVQTATTDAAGDSTLPLDLRATNAGKTEIDANIFIDTCDKLHRVIVVERGTIGSISGVCRVDIRSAIRHAARPRRGLVNREGSSRSVSRRVSGGVARGATTHTSGARTGGPSLRTQS